MRLGFAGTPVFACRILEALLQAGYRPAVVYTQPDRPSGRGRKQQPSAVKALAVAQGLPVRQPISLRPTEETAALAAFQLDLLVVAAYGLILPQAILAAPRFGCINVHASLLPRWRGAAPIERAIMAGDSETGVCIMQMERGLDTGPVYLCRPCAITPDTDAPALEARLAVLGGEALLTCLDQLPELRPAPQATEGVTYASKLTRADAHIDWHRPAAAIERQVRALCGRLPPFTAIGAARLSVLEAQALEQPAGAAAGTIVAASSSGIRVACAEGTLNVTLLKLNLGKGQPLQPGDAINGYGGLFAIGTVVGREIADATEQHIP